MSELFWIKLHNEKECRLCIANPILNDGLTYEIHLVLFHDISKDMNKSSFIFARSFVNKDRYFMAYEYDVDRHHDTKKRRTDIYITAIRVKLLSSIDRNFNNAMFGDHNSYYLKHSDIEIDNLIKRFHLMVCHIQGSVIDNMFKTYLTNELKTMLDDISNYTDRTWVRLGMFDYNIKEMYRNEVPDNKKNRSAARKFYYEKLAHHLEGNVYVIAIINSFITTIKNILQQNDPDFNADKLDSYYAQYEELFNHILIRVKLKFESMPRL